MDLGTQQLCLEEGGEKGDGDGSFSLLDEDKLLRSQAEEQPNQGVNDLRRGTSSHAQDQPQVVIAIAYAP